MQKNWQGRALSMAFVFVLCALPALAQETAGSVPYGRQRDLLASMASTAIFGSLGILISVLGFKFFDLVVKHNIEQEVFEKNNLAAAILAGAIVLGVCGIVAATILSP